MKVIFIRHGKTKGNEEHKYIGVTDEPLSEKGALEIKSNDYPESERIISSPMKRCLDTAEIIYKIKPEIFCDLKEYDFGEFENKSFEDLKDNPIYKKWLNSKGTTDFPVGEGQKNFSQRCCNCFKDIIKNNVTDSVAFVVHGGTIMAILEKYAYPQKSFYDWHIENGKGYVFELKDRENIKLEFIELI